MVVGYLLESGGEGREFAACCRSIAAPVDLGQLRWPQSLKTRLVETVREQLQLRPPSARRLIYHLRGPAGTGKRSLAAGICHALGVKLLDGLGRR